MNYITLSELMIGIRRVFERSFANQRIRVLAEITDVKVYPARFYAFFNLVEKQGEDAVASASAAIWRNQFHLISKFEKTTGVKFNQNLELVLEVEVSFHERYGLRLSVVDIDSSYTLGKIEQEREAVLRRLSVEKPHLLWLEDGEYVSANSLKPKSLVMQRVALVTAPNSDGRRDFIKELTENAWGMGYAITEFPAAVQGQTAVADLCRSFDLIHSAATEFDVVALVRGGGGNTDFSAFDHYDVAERIAGCARPVFTGIGHDRNVSVADVVCHTMLKTPTRCAAAITEHNLQFLSVVQNSRTKIGQSAKRFIELGVNNMADQKRRLSNAIQWRIKQETDRLNQSAKHFELLYPKYTLSTGYALVRKDGKVVKSIQDLTPGSVVEIRLADGTTTATITNNEQR